MAKGKKGKSKQVDTFGLGGDDVEYGLDGKFSKVMDVINDAFHPRQVDITKKNWDAYLASIGGVGKYQFGKFSEILLTGKFNSASNPDPDFPTDDHWAETSFGNANIDPQALKDIIGLLRDGLKPDPATPMYFWVKESLTGKHYVEWKTGIIATMYCPKVAPTPAASKKVKAAKNKKKVR